MNIINKIIKSVDLSKIQSLTGDMYELALSRMVCIELAKYYYRDEIFFLFKENLEDREDIYNRVPKGTNKNITCNSLCIILEQILRDHYGLNVKMNSVFSDRFAHKDVVLTTKSGKKYILNPLMDLVEYKVGFETTNFASKKMSDFYKSKIPDIDYISKEELLQIDETIGYTTNGKYKSLDDVHCDSIEDALKVIFDVRGYLNGIVDLKIFSSLKLSIILGRKIKIKDIYIDKQDIKDETLKQLEFRNNNRYRGLIIEENGFVYLFPINNTFVKYTEEEWNKLVSENNININTYAYVENLNKLKDLGIDRNIIHNRKFLEIFSYYENLCKQDGKNILDYIDYSKKIIRVRYKCDLMFYIEGNHLVMIDYQDKQKSKYVFEDENRVREDKKSFTESSDTSLIDEYLQRTDVLGMFHTQVENSDVLDYVTKSEDGYLSRNYSQYYSFETYKELLDRRDRIINILLRNKNLSNDEKYILLENLLNISSRLYYLSCLSNTIERQEDKINQNYEMFVNDITNFISFIMQLGIPFNFKKYEEMKNNFDRDMVLHKKRQIELDNKTYIISYINKLLELIKEQGLEDYFVITPGFGSIYLGPFISSLEDKKSSILLYSKYKKACIPEIEDKQDFEELIANPSGMGDKPIILLDDNMGTGTTMKHVRDELTSNGHNVLLSGAYQYTFDRLQEYSIKDRGQGLFDPYAQDLLTPVNYPRHQILEKAVTYFGISPEDYIKYLNLFGYHRKQCSDYKLMLDDADYFYRRFTGKDIDSDDQLKPTSLSLIRKLKGE